MNTPISFRLRKDLDADLIDVVDTIDRKNLNNLCRDGLRLMLGIRTTKMTTVTEQPLIIPERTITPERALPWLTVESKSKSVSSKPAVYIPQRRG